MKKIIASAGLVALGATGLHAQMAPGLTRVETTKPWSISAALRGFYDDNYVAAPSHSALEDDSFGIELRPSVSLNLFPQDQTYLGASYTYSARYYEARSSHTVDHTHEANLKLDHRLSERYKASFTDSFLYAQEPELTEGAGAAQTTFILRQDLDVFRNRAAFEFSGQATELLGAAVGYQNTWYDYENDEFVGGRNISAALDRMEHLIRLDGRWQARPDLVGILGYQFGIFDYTSDDRLTTNPNSLTGDDRDYYSHFVYVGADYSVSEQLTTSGRVGVQYSEWDVVDESEWNPYAQISASYAYLPGSSVQIGIRHERNATDVAATGNLADVTLDQESTVLYGSVSHKITTRLTGSLLAQYQRSEFNGGNLDGDIENFFLAGVNLQYYITPNISAEAGYNFDRLDSDLGSRVRSFSRNRVYVGVRATY